MKGLIAGIFLLAALVTVKAETETHNDDPHSQEGDTEPEKRKLNMPGGAIDKAEFKKNFRDLLGHAWTNFDMEGLDFYILPMLNYSSSALEPYFTAEQVRYHWEGNNEQNRRELNTVLNEWRKEEPESELAYKSLVHMIENVQWVPSPYYERVHRHASSYMMHSIYFGTMSGNYENEERFPIGKVRYGIEKNFRDITSFRAKFNIMANKLHGSGFTCLVKREDGLFKIENYPDVYSPLISGGYPLLVLDMWEHAWYLKHKHVRSRYIEDWWMVVDWNQVEALNEFWETYDSKKKQQQEEQQKQKQQARDESPDAPRDSAEDKDEL